MFGLFKKYYHVAWELESGEKDSVMILVALWKSPADAWDEAVAHTEENVPVTSSITCFKRVR